MQSPGSSKDPVWDRFIGPTPGPPAPAVMTLATLARDLARAVAGANASDEEAAHAGLLAWGHRHLRNRWIEADHANDRFPGSLLLAHSYGKQRETRVSALVDIEIDGSTGDIWLVLKNLLKMAAADKPTRLHPVPLDPAVAAKRLAGDDNFPKALNVVVDRPPQAGEDPVSRTPLRSMKLYRVWVRGATNSFQGTGDLKLQPESDLASLASFEEVLTTYQALRADAESKGKRTAFIHLYPNPPSELVSTAYGNEAVWGTGVDFGPDSTAPTLPYGAAITGVYATSMPSRAQDVEDKMQATSPLSGGAATLIKFKTLTAVIPVYGSAEGDPSSVVHFDPVFEAYPPIPRKNPEQFVIDMTGRRNRVYRWLKERTDVDDDSMAARQLLLAARNVWLRESPIAAVKEAMGNRSLQISDDVRDSEVGEKTVAIFRGAVWVPFQRYLEQGAKMSLPPPPGSPSASPPASPPRPATPPPPPQPAPPVVVPPVPVPVVPVPVPGPAVVPVPVPVPVPAPAPALVARLPSYRPTAGPPSVDLIHNVLNRDIGAGQTRNLGMTAELSRLGFVVSSAGAGAPDTSWVLAPPIALYLGHFEVRVLGTSRVGKGLVVGWTRRSSHGGKSVKALGGRPSALRDPLTLDAGSRLAQVLLPVDGALTVLAADRTGTVSTIDAGSYRTTASAASGRVAGWITSASGAISGLVGGQRDSQHPGQFRVHYLLVNLDRVPV